ncbi:MAG: 2-phosphosulfolactate phosphatase [Tyzzerella sp.]|nr:2-phosphosulfolactate phosphatase [Tyzzerella sp.]
MEIQILQMIDGAKNAKGLTVIIDVFRAFSVEAYLLANGAKEIIPVGDMELAYKLKERNPDMILAGERHGAILPGFDIGNSPSQLTDIDVQGKTIIHTTSAGTQGIVNAVHAEEILGCSLVNARATAEYIKKHNPTQVSLVCMGLEAVSPTEEDTLCAEYIKSLLECRPMEMMPEIEKLKSTSGAKFFDKEQNHVFPENDFYMCTELDKFYFVLKFENSEDGLGYMRKEEV